jgi:hypothetical protein
MIEFEQPWPTEAWLGPMGIADSLVNIISGLGTSQVTCRWTSMREDVIAAL